MTSRLPKMFPVILSCDEIEDIKFALKCFPNGVPEGLVKNKMDEKTFSLIVEDMKKLYAELDRKYPTRMFAKLHKGKIYLFERMKE